MADRKKQTIQLRVTKDDYRVFHQVAKAANTSISHVIRTEVYKTYSAHTSTCNKGMC